VVVDPITGQGIGDAFRDAELLATAIEAGLGGRQPLDAALAGYRNVRDRRAGPVYAFTTDLAALRPLEPAERLFFEALASDRVQTDRFFGALNGAICGNTSAWNGCTRARRC
jgi:2-polyprenyl-6-methoxyphenol hydroxylase-like FAD-dependent oxidoreductase